MTHAYDLDGKPWKAYGNTGTPITMNMGGWRITYTQDGEIKVGFFCEATLSNAVHVFNSLDHTTGFNAGTLTIDRIDTFGNLTDTFTQEGRYGIPHNVKSLSRIRYRRRTRAYKRRAHRSS